jgi:hypothetical protein
MRSRCGTAEDGTAGVCEIHAFTLAIEKIYVISADGSALDQQIETTRLRF